MEHFIECFESDRLDQATCQVSQRSKSRCVSRATHYPSTPASKARRLSSKEDIPVNARIRVGVGESASEVARFRADSMLRISAVAPTPATKVNTSSLGRQLKKLTVEDGHRHV